MSVLHSPDSNPLWALEKQCAGHLEQIWDAQIVNWADFLTENYPGQSNRIVFGHQSSTYQTAEFEPNLGRSRLLDVATFELRIEVADLHNHGQAQSLARYALVNLLSFYQPFEEFSPLTANNMGIEGFDNQTGFWAYGGTLSTVLRDAHLKAEDLTPKVERSPPPTRIKISVWNDAEWVNDFTQLPPGRLITTMERKQ